MYITFKNNSENSKMIIFLENRKYILNPENSVDVFWEKSNLIFETQCMAFDELTDAINEFDKAEQPCRFKDKFLKKITKMFVEKLPEILLDLTMKYEVNFNNNQNVTINLYDGFYSVCDGKIADFFDIMGVDYVFSRAETDNEIKVVDVIANNRKKFLKLMRMMLLFINSSIIFVDWFLFIPEYFTIKFLSTHFYIKRLFKKLYNKTAEERVSLFYEKEQSYEKEENKKGCLSSLIKIFLVLLVLGGICFWGVMSEPEVIISEDFSSVTCFDETFVKIDGELPKDAEDVFLEDYSAYYPLVDGGYDMDNYYCHIYETPDGTRYMWLKDDCTNEENVDKSYEDYENPLVYKSTGEQK